MVRVGEGFPARLRQVRQGRGWTQAELARRASVRERQIIRWENSQHTPRLDHLAALARALGVGISELTDGDEDEEGDVARIRRVRAELVRLGHDDLADDLRRIAEVVA